MTINTHTQELLARLQQLLPVSDDEVVQRGVTETATARIVELRQRLSQLIERYGALQDLERQVQLGGVTLDDHTLYTDLLEWRAVRHELQELTGFLENL